MAGDRTIKVSPSGKKNCVRVTASVGGRATRWTVCAIGRIGEPAALSLSRRGRRGGARTEGRSNPGGMLVCSAKGENSKCVRAPYGAIAFPGGGSKPRRKGVQVFDGYKAKKRRRKARR